MRSRLARIVAAAALGGAVLGSAATADAAPHASGVLELSGTLHLTAGTCSGGRPAGSYLSVTFGTRAISNPASSCEGGAVTLLSPGRTGLSTNSFSPSSQFGFDSHGIPLATSIVRPVSFDGHGLGLVSASQDLQDAPTGPGLFSLPHIYVTGDQVFADVRSIQVLYGGRPDTTCATNAGAGCWLIGDERATGTYDAATHRVTLSWFSGQSFVPQSAGTAVHLSGVFVGAKPKPLAKGKVVELGTSSFAAGSRPPVSPVGARRPAHHLQRAGQAAPQPVASALADPHDSPLTQLLRSPAALAVALLLVGIDALGFATAFGRRRSS